MAAGSAFTQSQQFSSTIYFISKADSVSNRSPVRVMHGLDEKKPKQANGSQAHSVVLNEPVIT